jgi:hypothetical protein
MANDHILQIQTFMALAITQVQVLLMHEIDGLKGTSSK